MAKPAETSTNAAIARAPFGDKVIEDQSIPAAINDYNHYMNGVDIANQLRSNYEIHRKTQRNWFPLFIFFLNTAIINPYRIQYTYKQQQGASKSKLPSHREFRDRLCDQLFPLSNRIQPLEQPVREHHRIQLGDRLVCVQCKLKRAQSKVKPKGRAGTSTSGCLECGLAHPCVKGRCWDEWHRVAS